MNALRRRPSPALVIASLALFAATGGTSVAAPAVSAAKKLITGDQIKTGTISGRQVKDGSLTLKDVNIRSFAALTRSVVGLTGAPGAAGPAGAPGATGSAGTAGLQGTRGEPGTAGTSTSTLLLHARVNGAGDLVRGEGAVSATHLSAGHYEVRFDRQVRGCDAVASPVTAGFSFGEVIIDEAGALADDVVGVWTTSDVGNQRDSNDDEGFTLLVACPA